MNDRDWFDEQWRRHSGTVWAFARRRLPEADADDVVVATFATLWRRLPERHDVPWLLGVARNVIGTEYRAAARRHRLIDELRNAARVGPGGAPVDVSLLVTLEQALATLDPELREALTLVAWDGLTSSEAAQVVGCSPSAFRMRLLRGRRRLRSVLADKPLDSDLVRGLR